MFSRRLFVFVGLAGACARHACAQQAAGRDGEITESDIQKRLRTLEALSRTHAAPSREGVIEQLRDDSRTLQEAKSSGIEITDADLDQALSQEARRWGATLKWHRCRRFAADAPSSPRPQGVGASSLAHGKWTAACCGPLPGPCAPTATCRPRGAHDRCRPVFTVTARRSLRQKAGSKRTSVRLSPLAHFDRRGPWKAGVKL